MERAVQEVTESRLVIEADKIQLSAYEEAIDKAQKLDNANQAQITLMKAEAAKLRDALAQKQVALDAKQKEVDAYKAALAKETKKKNFYKKLVTILVPIAIYAVLR